MKPRISAIPLRTLLAAATLLTAATAAAQQRDTTTAAGRTAYTVDIEHVEVTATRPMKQIGVQRTHIDSAVLRDNISLSLADALTFNSTVFIKQYGRATLSTASFRGTSPSHTQVTWNGMKINSPMLGMTDFSMIPSYFIDDASLLHGTSSVNVTGGGLGGAIVLSTEPAKQQGFGLQYVQGAGSFSTFDEYLRLTYGNDRWQVSTRVSVASSPNDFRYTNRDKKENIYDDQHNIIGQYYPVERNRNGAFRDLHLLQEAYYNTGRGDRFGLTAWYVNSRRGIPLLSVSYADDDYENLQREHTLRSVLSWDRVRTKYKIAAKAGYVNSWLAYDYSRDLGNGVMAQMIRSGSSVNTIYGQFGGVFYAGRKGLLTADITAHQHFVVSSDKNIITQQGGSAVVGYDKARIELSGYVSAKWRPTDRLGISAALREEIYGGTASPVIPAAFVDYLVSRRGQVVVKASVSRNYRFPTLNDLYFLPGGNPDLKKENGFSYDGGIEASAGDGKRFSINGSATAFDSYIDDWIIWLPNAKGYWTPKNIKRVHAYGVELKGSLRWRIDSKWNLSMDGNFAWTPSINQGEKISEADRSVGKQLVYVPEYSSSVTGRLAYGPWRLVYRWCYYSERYTMSSNDNTITGYLTPYFMNDLSIERLIPLRWADTSVKLQINNLFNEEYRSVLAHPMPRMNFEVFLDIRPRWGKNRAER